MEFIKSNKDLITFEMEIMNSHPEYNILSDGKAVLTYEDLIEEHEEELEKERYIIKYGNEMIGIIDFIMENPRDKKPWLGLLVIHKAWTGNSYAKKALDKYEDMMGKRNVTLVRLGCFGENSKGMNFWQRNGFEKVKEISFREKPLWIMEKKL
jgi:RimJ/RimL family protein N-acetyltransferase